MEIQFISVCLRAAEESSVTINLQANGWKPAVCTADAAAPKTVQMFSTVSRRTCELNPTDFCEKTQLRQAQLDVPSLLRARRVPAGYGSEVMQAWLLCTLSHTAKTGFQGPPLSSVSLLPNARVDVHPLRLTATLWLSEELL